MRTPKTAAAAAAAAAAIITLAACDADSSDTTSDSPRTTEDTDSSDIDTDPGTTEDSDATGDMEITSHAHTDHDVWGPDAYVVTYTITNTGPEPASYFASIEFLDDDGDYLGSTGITADRLGTGKSTEGDTAPLDAEIDHGDIADIADVQIGQVDRTTD